MHDVPAAVPGDVSDLHAVADAFAAGGDIDAVLRDLLAVAVRATGADVGAVFLQDPDRAALEPAVSQGIEGSAWVALGQDVGAADDDIAAAARDRAGVRLSQAEAGAESGFLARTGASRAALEPIVVRRGGIEQGLGVLALGWPATTEDPVDQRGLAPTFAALMGIAVDHGRLASLVAERSEWFERMSQSDPLTGLANERMLARALELELARAARQGSQLSVVIFDVDGFVGLNERIGHEAGDGVLRSVAAVLNESVRLVDTVARIGGDEFVVLAPGSAGATLARRVIDGVGGLDAAAGERVSISAGVARFPADGESAGELLDAAAAALGQAKEQGAASLHEASGAASH